MNQAQVRKRWQIVDGVLLLDKPGGLSSNDALQKARRLFSAAKAGHTVEVMSRDSAKPTTEVIYAPR